MNQEELAWCAGFLDGEGTFGFSDEKSGGRGRFYISAVQTHRHPLDRLASALGGNVTGPYLPLNRKPWWMWKISRFVLAEQVVSDLWPWLSDHKKDQVTQSLEKYHNRRPDKRLTKG